VLKHNLHYEEALHPYKYCHLAHHLQKRSVCAKINEDTANLTTTTQINSKSVHDRSIGYVIFHFNLVHPDGDRHLFILWTLMLLMR